MTTQEQVDKGEVCARCGVEFDGAHGRPVLCHTCAGRDLLSIYHTTPKAWLEEKAP